MASIKNRLRALEHRLMNLFPRWASDDDGFLEALGISGPEKEKYRRINPDGSEGFDILNALNKLAATAWEDGDDLP